MDRKVQQLTLGMTRIMAIALIAGVVIMSAVMYLVAQSGPQAPPADPQLKTILLAAAGGIALMSAIVPRFVMRGVTLKQAAARWQGRVDDAGGVRDVVGLFASYAIFSLAMTEGWGLLGAVTTMLTRDPAVLAVPGACVLFLVAKFPTRDRWREYFRDATGQEAPSDVN